MSRVPLPVSVAARLNDCPYPLLFATVSGAHLYGFESPDSDWDLRGAFIAPTREVVSLRPGRETYELMDKEAVPEVDLVAHEVKKFFGMLLKNNGYVLEQVFSPLVAAATPEFEELRRISRSLICKQHRHHFYHFGTDQWKLVTSKSQATVKGLLYTYRPLLAGIHLMRTGEVESNIRRLNSVFRLGLIDELVERKLAGQEKMVLREGELEQHRPTFDQLCLELDRAREQSALPDEVPEAACAELNDLLLRLRGV